METDRQTHKTSTSNSRTKLVHALLARISMYSLSFPYPHEGLSCLCMEHGERIEDEDRGELDKANEEELNEDGGAENDAGEDKTRMVGHARYLSMVKPLRLPARAHRHVASAACTSTQRPRPVTRLCWREQCSTSCSSCVPVGTTITISFR
jgi:hypothetical protein